MANTSNLIGIQSQSFDKEGQDTFTLRYQVEFDAIQTDPYVALPLAKLATPDPVPSLRSVYPGRSNIFVSTISVTVADESRSVFNYDVAYAVPAPNEQEPAGQDADPSNRPGRRNIEYIATENPIVEARNVEGLSHGDGKGGNRAASTLGPIVNAAGKRADESLMETTYEGVLVFEKNYPTIGAIDALNQDYVGTTNSAAVLGYDARRLKYLVTESLGQLFEGENEYWPGLTRVAIKKTTDLIIDNVGYDYWKAKNVFANPPDHEEGWIRAKDLNGDDMAEPINLKLNGDKGGNHTEVITYRYLEEKAYGPLFT
jgi:hypothetical protein